MRRAHVPRSWQDSLCLAFCRLGATGCATVAPGTWASALAAVLAPIWFLPLSFQGRALVLLALFFIGTAATTRGERLLNREDPPELVVDELLGMWLTLLPFATVSVSMLVAAFVLFRLFDIWKPWPVGASEHWLRSGGGIMLDDVLAGCMAMLCVAGLQWLGWV